MRKLALTIGALLLSINAIAATSHNLNSAILKATQSHAKVIAIKSSFPMTYGGQDFSRSLVAIANETVWSGQRTLIG